MLTSVAGAVVPLTQLQSELSSFFSASPGWAGGRMGRPASAGLSAAAHAWVASEWPLGLPFAAIPAGPLAGIATGVAPLGVTALGRASSLPGLARQRPMAPSDRGADSGRWRSFLRHRRRLSELLLPGHFTGGAGRSRSARRRRAGDPYRSRGARGIPPGQSRFRIADSGHRALRPSGGRSVRCRSFGVIGCRPSEGIARRPSGGVKRRILLDKVA